VGDRVRALTVRQPWADLLVAGVKDVENRTKPFPSTVTVPARIGIHAGAAMPPNYGGPDTRLGALLGFVWVSGCHHADDCYAVGHRPDDAGCNCGVGPDGHYGYHEPGCGLEPYCSPWAEPDRWHWTVADPEPLDKPVPMKGMLGLWTLNMGGN
jgi:hypothetical protein